ncbi:hypothetical protein CROQUDRAFT_662312 [Cronartium quercuum f. sp. fusiforme G11]|uniref:Uncharacterized protein n=1 Tax=Cronartium quercuum f. sp. fusiforme G11 TaxID=708437 RepID=A0A9P6NAY8_9BASI|nr:hypothetical protein CROQUDRAFT_662312 [Cronartium quercuum f. sp. fusiforme G11]
MEVKKIKKAQQKPLQEIKASEVKDDPTTSASVHHGSLVSPKILTSFLMKPSSSFSYIIPVTSNFFSWFKHLVPRPWRNPQDGDRFKAFRNFLQKKEVNRNPTLTSNQNNNVDQTTRKLEDVDMWQTTGAAYSRLINRNHKQVDQMDSLAAIESRKTDLNEIRDLWRQIKLDDKMMEALYVSLNLQDQTPMTSVTILSQYKQLLREQDKQKLDEGIFWLKKYASTSNVEFTRRRSVLYHQIKQYEIFAKWKETQGSLISHNSRPDVQLVYRLNQEWPTFTDIDAKKAQAISAAQDRIVNIPGLLEVVKDFLGAEWQIRTDLLEHMLNRKSSSKWWVETQIREARSQGVNIIDVLVIGDHLNFDGGTTVGAISIPRNEATKRAEALYRYIMKIGKKKSSNKWADSSERDWFLKYYPDYHQRLKALIIGCDSMHLPPGSAILESLGLRGIKPWWTFGELLFWTDEGLLFDLKTRNDLVKIKDYFLVRSRWNEEHPRPGFFQQWRRVKESWQTGWNAPRSRF